VAIVTGGAAQTGRFLARRLGEDGAAVVVGDIDRVGGEGTVEAIKGAGGQAAFVRADMRVDGDIEALVAFEAERFGSVDILVNSAGGGGNIAPHFPDASPAAWSSWLDLNLRGPMVATQVVLEPMRWPVRVRLSTSRPLRGSASSPISRRSTGSRRRV
jgi:NAD(P)-dependent dehydrogenase (short-subunit alcohol dehydrogenase family)